MKLLQRMDMAMKADRAIAKRQTTRVMGSRVMGLHDNPLALEAEVEAPSSQWGRGGAKGAPKTSSDKLKWHSGSGSSCITLHQHPAL